MKISTDLLLILFKQSIKPVIASTPPNMKSPESPVTNLDKLIFFLPRISIQVAYQMRFYLSYQLFLG